MKDFDSSWDSLVVVSHGDGRMEGVEIELTITEISPWAAHGDGVELKSTQR